MIEEKFGLDMVDELIETVNPASNGAYTSVGTYDHKELLNYVSALSEKTAIPVNQLVYTFGMHLAQAFSQKFPEFFDASDNCFSFLKNVDSHIHLEVEKLYTDTELPQFTYAQASDRELTLYYKSCRGLADAAHGLIQGVANYYQEPIEIARSGEWIDGIQHETFSLHLSHDRS